MTVWTPQAAIRVKVLGLAWRGAELLVGEVEDRAGRIKGVRPLGGCIEFGESRERALKREFIEELGCAVEVVGPWHGLENIFEHEGATGHEYIFAANVQLADYRLHDQDRFQFLESDESACWAVWMRPDALPAGVDFYPTALLDLIRRRD